MGDLFEVPVSIGVIDNWLESWVCLTSIGKMKIVNIKQRFDQIIVMLKQMEMILTRSFKSHHIQKFL
jgi:23S rRNA C2498 (ribose-2'-O)-methylase RlmM